MRVAQIVFGVLGTLVYGGVALLFLTVALMIVIVAVAVFLTIITFPFR